MKRLNKKQAAQLTELTDAVETAKIAVDEKVEELNDAIVKLEGFRQEMRDDMESYYEEKSERWQEGDNGQMYYDWMNAWDQEVTEVESPDVEVPEYPEEPGL